MTKEETGVSYSDPRSVQSRHKIPSSGREIHLGKIIGVRPDFLRESGPFRGEGEEFANDVHFHIESGIGTTRDTQTEETEVYQVRRQTLQDKVVCLVQQCNRRENESRTPPTDSYLNLQNAVSKHHYFSFDWKHLVKDPRTVT